jgi:DNA-directed RNA polymerase alpha subunit
MSKAWERRGLTLRSSRALVNNGIVTLDDLYQAHDLELATIPGVGQKSLAVLYALMGREVPRSGGRPVGRTRVNEGPGRTIN